MRVNVQLIDAESGGHIWAERFDKPLADLFDMQDEIVAGLASALNGNSSPSRGDARNRPESRTPWTSIFRVWLVSPRVGPRARSRKRAGFLIALSPPILATSTRSSDRRMRICDGSRAILCRRPESPLTSAESKLTKALSSVPDHSLAHTWWEWSTSSRSAAQGIAGCEHALELNRNLANAHAMIGYGKLILAARKKPKLILLRPCASVRAIRWLMSGWLTQASGAPARPLGASGRLASSVDRGQPEFSACAFFPGAALAQLGRLDEARAAVKAGLALNPAYTISRVRANLVARSDNSTFLAQLEPIFGGMRKAGVSQQ